MSSLRGFHINQLCALKRCTFWPTESFYFPVKIPKYKCTSGQHCVKRCHCVWNAKCDKITGQFRFLIRDYRLPIFDYRFLIFDYRFLIRDYRFDYRLGSAVSRADFRSSFTDFVNTRIPFNAYGISTHARAARVM